MPAGDKGGFADKFGNEFEWLWTSDRLADLLESRAASITIEPQGREGEGVEFWIEREDRSRSYHQVKFRSSGSWTLNALLKAKVLTKVKPHLEAGHAFHLVSSISAPDLDLLSALARADGDHDVFVGAVPNELQADLRRLTEAWEVPDDVARRWLSQITTELWSEPALRRHVLHRYEVIFGTQGEDARNRLREGCARRLREQLSGPDLEAMLAVDRPISRSLLVTDPGRESELRELLHAHLRRLDRRAPSLKLPARTEVAQIVELLRDPDGNELVVLDGAAGSGKSAVAGEVARELSSSGWTVLPLSMDRLQEGDVTTGAITSRFDLRHSPAALVAASSRSHPSLLLIDQLDALSTFGGRLPDCLDAVQDIVEALITDGGQAKVLVVVRTVDLDHDERIAGLARRSAARCTVGLLPEASVRAAVSDLGTDPGQLPATTLELLRNPLHLALFSRLDSSRRAQPIQTLTDLYRRFIDGERRSLERSHPGFSWSAIVDPLAHYMSEHAQLTAPRSILREPSPTHVGAMASVGVIHIADGAVQFFHETFFDHVFAEAFIAGQADLVSWLAAGPQVLYRRTQVRQILAQLEETDRPRFLTTVVDLLTSDAVRSHIKDTVASALTTITPQPGDWRLIDQVIKAGGWIAERLVRLLRSPGWFDVADQGGHVAEYLADPSLVTSARWAVLGLADSRGSRVVELLRPHLGAAGGWDEAILGLTWRKFGPEVAAFLADLVDHGHFDPSDTRNALNPRLWRVLGDLEDDSSVSCELLGAVLRRADHLAQQAGLSDPFSAGLLPEGRGEEARALAKIAARDTSAFLTNVLPFLESVGAAGETFRNGLTRPAAWAWLHSNGDTGFAPALFHASLASLRMLARSDPREARRIADRLGRTTSSPLRLLAASTYVALGPGPSELEWLLSDGANLELGWDDSPHWISRQMIVALCETSSDAEIDRLEDHLLRYFPESRYGLRAKGMFGLAQRDLLTAIPVGRLSPRGWKRRLEIERALPPMRAPGGSVGGGWVQPPISVERQHRMSDADWLRAMTKYQTDDSPRWDVGGVTQMAQSLRTEAEAEPDRFVALARAHQLPVPYLDAVVTGVKGHIMGSTLAELCLALAQRSSSAGRTICWAIEANRSDDVRLCRLIEFYATDPDPPADAALDEGDDLDSKGINCVRGAAAEAAGSLIWAHPALLGRIEPTVRRLAADPSPAVRVATADAVLAISNHDRALALDLAEQVLTPGIDILGATRARHLFTWCCIWDPQRFLPILRRALDANGEPAATGGFAWAVTVLRDITPEGAPDDVRSLSCEAKRGAAEVFADAPSQAIGALCVLIDDDDVDVRQQAAAFVDELDSLATTQLRPLLAAFSSSRSLPEHGARLMRALTKVQQLLPIRLFGPSMPPSMLLSETLRPSCIVAAPADTTSAPCCYVCTANPMRRLRSCAWTVSIGWRSSGSWAAATSTGTEGGVSSAPNGLARSLVMGTGLAPPRTQPIGGSCAQPLAIGPHRRRRSGLPVVPGRRNWMQGRQEQRRRGATHLERGQPNPDTG